MYLKKWSYGFAVLACGAFLCGCSSGSSPTSPGTPAPQAQNGTVSMIVSDDSTEDWAGIDVKILSIALTPQGGGANVTVYTAPSPAPGINLVELDQLGEILGNITVPAGSYTAAQLIIGGNPGDVSLQVSADPEAGFAGTAGALIPSN